MDELMHEGRSKTDGAPIGSGRYPLGSGDNPYQHPKTFLARVERLKQEGLSDTDIAKSFGMSLRELRSEKSLARTSVREQQRAEVVRLRDREGMGWTDIAKELGMKNESSVRSLYDPLISKKQEATKATIDVLRRNVDEKNYIDVGVGVASSMGITDTRLQTAVKALEKEGYEVKKIYVEQLGTGNNTTVKVLAKPGTTTKELYEHKGDIGLVNERFTSPTGKNLYGLKKPKSISSDRVQVLGKESGGEDKDGVIELRRGVEDLSLGNARYAQVRIAVDGTHYLKGMAIYADDLPDGIDIRVNSKHSDSLPKHEHFKTLKDDPDNPFGAEFKREGGVPVQRGYLNIVNEEGDWDAWSRTLSAQVLSKQSTQLAKRQLSLTLQDRKQEFDEIQSLTNPTLKKHMLEQFADNCDSAAVHLKAAALPRQSSHVILPITSLKENEIYAPSYPEGSTVVLIRYPHGGTFEIPELKVNKRNKEAKRVMENAVDAVGINPKVAKRLSGADFDGDTVLVIPNDSGAIRTTAALKALKDFDTETYKDPRYEKPKSEGGKKIGAQDQQKKMGEVSNLVTDMTLQGAPSSDIAKAVKHSMVIIDAEKHGLNYRQSAIDNDIDALKRKYQPKPDGTYGGASTLISRAKSEQRVRRRVPIKPDPVTGEKRYRDAAGSEYVDAKGRTRYRTMESTKMAETNDARTLLSTRKTAMEVVYADYANQMKALANQARKASLSTSEPPRSPEARIKYKDEVESLERKRTIAKAHAPYERKAQLAANEVYQAKLASNPAMTPDQKKKVRTQALAEQRARHSPEGRPKIDITDREWEAIQKNAVSKTLLRDVFKYADQDALKKRATPKAAQGLTSSKLSLARTRLDAGYTIQEVAKSLGVSESSLKKALYS